MPEDSEQTARKLIRQMLESLELYSETCTCTADDILAVAMNKDNVQQIIDDIIALLPIEPVEDQHSIIEITAEQLFSLQQAEV